MSANCKVNAQDYHPGKPYIVHSNSSDFGDDDESNSLRPSGNSKFHRISSDFKFQEHLFKNDSKQLDLLGDQQQE
jgi:hypothetical protein